MACNNQDPDIVEQNPIDALLATVPNEYFMDTHNYPNCFVAPYAGSMLKYIADLFRDCTKRLWLINPYWSQQGAERLKRHLGSTGLNFQTATILTQKQLSQSDLEGLQSIVSYLQRQRVTVTIYTPNPLPSGGYPLLHAKVVIADTTRCYLGSANLTDNGLSNSVEIGVGLKGPVVKSIERWVSAIVPYCSKYDV